MIGFGFAITSRLNALYYRLTTDWRCTIPWVMICTALYWSRTTPISERWYAIIFYEKSKNTLLVDTAENGQEGVEKAYENAYDILILDVMLPEMDGFEICREVRRHSDVPIIFLTARVAEEDMLRGYALGCDDYVTKPFPLPVQYEKVNAANRSEQQYRLVIWKILSIKEIRRKRRGW